MHPLMEYWKNVFGFCEVPMKNGIAFAHPQFRDPLMSPRFILGEGAQYFKSQDAFPEYLNIIGDRKDFLLAEDYGYRLKKRMCVGLTAVDANIVSTAEVEVQSLATAMKDPVFFRLLEEGFPKDIGFLQTLLQHLPETNADYVTLFLKDKGETAAMVTAGINGNLALVLNAVVKTDKRGRGMSGQLVEGLHGILAKREVKTAMFWTDVAQVIGKGDAVTGYGIFIRE